MNSDESWTEIEIAAKLAAELGMTHRDGVPWWQAPVPRRWHRCRPHTSACVAGMQVDRCACGGVRLDGFGPWIERNSARSRR